MSYCHASYVSRRSTSVENFRKFVYTQKMFLFKKKSFNAIFYRLCRITKLNPVIIVKTIHIYFLIILNTYRYKFKCFNIM